MQWLNAILTYCFIIDLRGGSRAAATSKMERFVIIVNGRNPLTIITEHYILDVAAPLDSPLDLINFQWNIQIF